MLRPAQTLSSGIPGYQVQGNNFKKLYDKLELAPNNFYEHLNV